MPELPDLVYIQAKLEAALPEQTITEVTVREPIVIRNHSGRPFDEVLTGLVFQAVKRSGPFLEFRLSGDDDNEYLLVIHPMLAGRFFYREGQGERPASNKSGYRKNEMMFRFQTDRGEFAYLDSKKMGKVYLVARSQREKIPNYPVQGLDILSDEFTLAAFLQAMGKSRKQVRVFIMDKQLIDSVGNAYADEILFKAGIHPKTPCNKLSPQEREILFESIKTVMQWGIQEVENAGRPIDVKVREHLRVRNRKNETCTVCGEKIRRTQVLGHDAFFCPACQPAADGSRSLW